MSTPDNLNAQNNAVKGWFGTTYRKIKGRYMRLVTSANRSGDSLDRLKYKTKSKYGEVDQGGFIFDRHLVFVHKGAGKGHGGTKGSSWIGPNGERKRTNPNSFGKMNTGERQAEEWLNPVLEEEVPKLADIVAGFKADAAVKQIQIK
ncbi:hypothetical protein KHS38_11690 [Mucilaginibacter sp. Bleaf8]|uniref:hypothetical protein n=1 Tax=Mucilaginibacter sp. Bleaf8 TaxID=2834430 RepID=UPI001BCBF174|nr:hypothetical protein [Mucilaginibacter sp. Bleaf8]MBS7565067.1 hypothetical protein [Mucilaginibacter sp. Bleaf8]